MCAGVEREMSRKLRGEREYQRESETHTLSTDLPYYRVIHAIYTTAFPTNVFFESYIIYL